MTDARHKRATHCGKGQYYRGAELQIELPCTRILSSSWNSDAFVGNQYFSQEDNGVGLGRSQDNSIVLSIATCGHRVLSPRHEDDTMKAK